MSIAALKKVAVLGPASQVTVALEELQNLGCMHLLPLAPAPDNPEDIRDRSAKDAYKAYHFLKAVEGERRQVRRAKDFDIAAFAAEVLALRQEIRQTRDKIDFLKARIAAVEPWGDLEFPPLEELCGQRFWFYQVPLKDRDALDEVDVTWQIVARDTRFLFVVVIMPEEPPADLLPVARTRTGSKPLRVLIDELEDTEIALEALEADRSARTRFLGLMRESLSKAESLAEIDFAHQQVLQDQNLFALQGWVPQEHVDDVTALADAQGYALLVEDPLPDEKPPTLLDQPQERSAGVDLAMFYQVPGYRDWDPTVLLVASFAMFFAMIVADAGYGLIIAGGLALYWKTLGRTAHARSWRQMLALIAGATVLYGVLVGSYLGFAPTPGGVLDWFKIMSVDDFGTMMTLSIVIGVFHLVLANVLAARARWGRNSAYASLGWCAVLIGGLTYWLTGDNDASGIGVALMIAGIAAVAVYSSERAVKSPADWVWRVLDGAQGLTGLMGLFGDVLSYMRLFALGLASASLAITFNDLAGDIREAVPGLGLLLALLVFLIGHVLNFGLALMSGVVHGLRLNYMEFFKWSLSEEGTPFRPLARKEIDA